MMCSEDGVVTWFEQLGLKSLLKQFIQRVTSDAVFTIQVVDFCLVFRVITSSVNWLS